jgi:hypothetical protein
VLPNVVVPVGAVVADALGEVATATVIVLVETDERFPAASTT